MFTRDRAMITKSEAKNEEQTIQSSIVGVVYCLILTYFEIPLCFMTPTYFVSNLN